MDNGQISSNPKDAKHNYDLEERTLKLGQEIIDFTGKFPQNVITKPLIGQLARAGTSVGANHCEADEAKSKKGFLYKISIAKKEARETKYWLQIISHTLSEFNARVRSLRREVQELNLIFAAILRTTKKRSAPRH